MPSVDLPSRKLFPLVALLVPLFLGGLVASTAISASAATGLSLTMTARNACAPTSLTAPAGEVRIALTNPLDDWQSFGVSGVGIGTPARVRDGATSTLVTNLGAGTYTFWCGDDADDDDVMRGTLTIAPAGGTTTGGGGSGGGTATPPPPSTASVTASDDFFTPSTMRVSAGAVSLTVTNSGRSRHTFTIPNLVNAILEPGETRQVSFTAAAGTYTFFCGFHGEMRGALVVEGGGSGPPPPPSTTTSTIGATAPAPSAGGGGGTLSVVTSDFAFAPATLSASAGTISLTVRNDGQLPHTFTIEGVVNIDVAPGQSKAATFTLGTGTYRFYCAYGGHAEAGMTGVLIVSASGGSANAPPTQAPTGGASPAGATPTPVSTSAGGHTHGAAPMPKASPLRCRRMQLTIAGEVVSATRSAIVVHVTAAAPRAARASIGKHVSIARSERTAIVATGAVLDAGLAAAQRVRVQVAPCGRGKTGAIARRITVLPSVAATVLELAADPSGLPRFDKATLEAQAGRITLRLTNPSPIPHSIAIDGKAYGKVVGRNGVSSITVTLKRGRYTYFCTVSGHTSAGMKGTLIVR